MCLQEGVRRRPNGGSCAPDLCFLPSLSYALHSLLTPCPFGGCRPSCPSDTSGNSSAAAADRQQTEPSSSSSTSCCQDACGPLQGVNFIPVFGSTAKLLIQRPAAAAAAQQRDDTAPARDKGNANNNSTAVDPAVGMQHVNEALLQQQHSLQLALEQSQTSSSSADWHPQPLDTLVAVMGAPPAWLCASDSSGLSFLAGSSRRAVLSGTTTEQVAAAHAPKLCVTVSTVSGSLDSLAILPLHAAAPPPAQQQAGAARPTPPALDSHHVGEF